MIYRICENEYLNSRPSKVIIWQKLRVVTSGHLAKMAVTPFDPIRHNRKPHATRKPHYAVFYREWVICDRSLHCGNRNFDCFAIVPLTWTRGPSYRNWTRTPCRYTVNITRLLKVIVWQTYRHTDKLGVVTSGHLTKMAVTPFDPPYLKTPLHAQTWWLYFLQNLSYGRPKFTLHEK